MKIGKRKMKKEKRNSSKLFLKAGLLAFSLGVIGLTALPHEAKACATCTIYEQALMKEFQVHRNWMNNDWWTKNIEPALKQFADEFRNASLFEAATFGAFLDGQNAMTTQRALQESATNSLKNYTTSDTICKFGTLSKSLALSQNKAKANQLVLSERSLGRQLGQKNMAAAGGEPTDRSARLVQFQEAYCDPQDFGAGMKILCTAKAKDERLNIDINYTRAIDTKNSLDIDFTDADETNDEKDVIALANNLYAHKVFDRINPNSLKQGSNVDAQTTFLDQRAIVAKRNVAENSFNEIVGQKSAGGMNSAAYMLEALKALGLGSDDAQKYLGDSPSYDVQMEVLTKKLYQDPSFYASLMDSPANVNRQYAALQSFGLMQKRDIFETVARSEMLMSLLLEMEIAKYQDNIQTKQ